MSLATSSIPLPAWLEVIVIPILNIIMALFFAGLIMLAIGVNPVEAVGIMIFGAFGYDEAIGYTLYYTTNFIFTGLAVAVAFHASLFNIGGEGQAAPNKPAAMMPIGISKMAGKYLSSKRKTRPTPRPPI